MLLHAHSIVSTVISCIASKSNSNQNKDFKICVSVKNVSIHVEVIEDFLHALNFGSTLYAYHLLLSLRLKF